jgi:hypothetical protein
LECCSRDEGTDQEAFDVASHVQFERISCDMSGLHAGYLHGDCSSVFAVQVRCNYEKETRFQNLSRYMPWKGAFEDGEIM